MREQACPRCGAAHEPLQEYCLECGLRLPLDRGLVPAVGRAWRLEISRYQGGWLWVVLVLLAVAAPGGVAALVPVGVLDSSRFASLRPRYYVIFSGFYRTVDAAQAAVEAAQKNGYRRAYEREVTP